VVDDDEAYLGYDEPDHTVEVNGTDTVTLVEVTNRFPQDLTTVEATATVEGGDPLDVKANDIDSLDPGETAEITGDVECSTSTTATVIVNVTASGSDTEVVLNGDTVYRRLSIECQ